MSPDRKMCGKTRLILLFKQALGLRVFVCLERPCFLGELFSFQDVTAVTT